MPAEAACTACSDGASSGDALNDGGASRDAGVADGRASNDATTSLVGDGAASRCCVQFVQRLATLDTVWPVLTVGTQTRSFSSFDRTGGNADGFDNQNSALYSLPSGEHVIFDAIGPGVLDTLWFTGPDEGGNGLDLGAVRFYLDDETAPRFAAPWSDLFSGDHAPFLSPLVADNHVSTGGFASWVPIPYARRLVVTTEKPPGFYQAHYETLPPDSDVTSFSLSMDVGPALARFAAIERIEPRTDVTEVPLDYVATGAGTLDAIQFTPSTNVAVANDAGDAALAAAHVRIFWNGDVTPSVDVPFGMFFGSGLGQVPVHALPFSIDGNVFENRFVMPYFRGFRLVIDGIAGTLRVHQGPPAYAEDEVGTFHAAYADEEPTTAGVDFEYLSATGAGKLVGTVLTVHPVNAATKKWWEGDLRSYANGARTPAIQGTGHEDDHLAGWSNTLFENPFTLPMQGEPNAEIIDRNGQFNANTTLYRFYPGIEYQDGLRHSTEHGDRNTVPGNYASVAFYYANPAGPTLVSSDSLPLSDAAARAAHAYTAAGESTSMLSSSFEGRDDRTTVTGAVTSHTGPASFQMTLAPGNRGCFLRRSFDQAAGRQGASVSVNGTLVGRWYTAEQNTTLRWAERDYFLPPASTSAASATITIVPDANGPPWSVAEYDVLCVVR